MSFILLCASIASCGSELFLANQSRAEGACITFPVLEVIILREGY